ncbi:hypothetical protein CDL15_Pgr011886 [Punica granatum]|uniref:Uncharacterized protein n=1 Tax=Punica granatum TaxID=22663 RepID=A0A218XE38_PUNGR|nr:hypothetical protein CDL15_Pgr011886 [Punica granatum]PKI49997.1 hypothetical protein CRG98_029618 [Punica granatum]
MHQRWVVEVWPYKEMGRRGCLGSYRGDWFAPDSRAIKASLLVGDKDGSLLPEMVQTSLLVGEEDDGGDRRPKAFFAPQQDATDNSSELPTPDNCNNLQNTSRNSWKLHGNSRNKGKARSTGRDSRTVVQAKQAVATGASRRCSRGGK